MPSTTVHSLPVHSSPVDSWPVVLRGGGVSGGAKGALPWVHEAPPRGLNVMGALKIVVLSLVAFLVAGCGVLDRPLWRHDRSGSSAVSKAVAPLTPTEQYLALRSASPSQPPVPLPEPELPLTPEVQREIQRYVRSERFLETALTRRMEYYPLMKQIFDDEGVPEELINLALVESAYNPDARSSAGAVGLWQFMKATAREYGLTVSRTEDQRRDPILSTIAAARHLRDLFSIFQDWPLALAAYNAGVGGVTRALIRTRTDDFWTLSRKKHGIKKQTKDYVPRFIAATLILNDLNAHGLSWLAERFPNAGAPLDVPQQALQNSRVTTSEAENDQHSDRAGNRCASVG